MYVVLNMLDVSNALPLVLFSRLLWCRLRLHALSASQKMTWQKGIWVMVWGQDPEDIMTISHKWRAGEGFLTSCPSLSQSKGAVREAMDPSLGHHVELCMLFLGRNWKLNELHSGRKDSRVRFLDLLLKSFKPVKPLWFFHGHRADLIPVTYKPQKQVLFKSY